MEDEEDCVVHLVDAELYTANNLALPAAVGDNIDDKLLIALLVARWLEKET